jgi:GT2 family glycosyltransferase
MDSFVKNKIGVLVVTYNQFELNCRWIEQFRRLFGSDGEHLHLLFLDNNSTDDTYRRLRDSYPDLDVRKLKDNYGCTLSRNVGIVELDRLGCEFYCSCDADVFIEDRDFFEKLLQAMQAAPSIDGFSPILRWAEDGSIQGMGGRRAWHGAVVAVMRVSGDRRIAYLPGGANFIRMAAFKKYGVYDTDLPPIAVEDYEWGVRASEMGAHFEYLPSVEVFHHHDKNRGMLPWTREWTLKGRMVFLRKHFNLGNLLREIRYGFAGACPQCGARLVLRAYWAGLRQRLSQDSHDFDAFVRRGTGAYYGDAE